MNGNEDRKVDLSRIQEDLERRRARQEAREREARAQREAKELEGCTFKPQLTTRKRKKFNMPPTPQGGQTQSFMNQEQEPVDIELADHSLPGVNEEDG